MEKKSKIITSIVILIFLFCSISIIYIGAFFLKTEEDKNDFPSWTIIIYMSGDNDLSEMLSKNRGLLKSVGSTDDLKIIALTDQENNGDTKLGLIELRNVNETELSVLDSNYTNELNLGDEKTLENFVTWSIDTYPNQNYCLIIWGHGKGCDGVGPDGEDYLTLDELDIALKNIVEFNNGKKLDIIGFDTCTMGLLEVFYQIKDYTKIAIASEKEIPERGWPYYDIFKPLVNDPKMTPRELSKRVVDEFTKAYAEGKIDDEGFSVTMSAVDLSKIDKIVEHLEYIPTSRSSLDFYEQIYYVDLYSYAKANNLKKLMSAINNSIILTDYWSNPENPIRSAYGMGIYYPVTYDENYDTLKFAQDTQWDDWVKENN